MKKIIPIILLFAVACNNNKIVEVQDVNITAEPLLHIKPLVVNPLYIYHDKTDENLFVNNGSSSKYSLQKISLQSGDVETLIRQGRGRGEYIQLSINDVASDGCLYGRSYPVELTFSSNGELLSSYNASEDNLNIFYTNRFRGMTVAYGNYNYPKSLLTLFDDSWQEICHFGEFPNDGISEAECGEFGKIMAYPGTILSSEACSRVAYVSFEGEFFSIYNIDDDNNVELVYNKQENLPQYKNQKGPGIGVTFTSKLFCYVSTCNTDKYIYILYSGKQIEENSNAGYYRAFCGEKILVYDWDGNHCYNLYSDETLVDISASSDDREIIATYYNEEGESCLCRFDISDL